jgi:patched domain-containing protein
MATAPVDEGAIDVSHYLAEVDISPIEKESSVKEISMDEGERGLDDIAGDLSTGQSIRHRSVYWDRRRIIEAIVLWPLVIWKGWLSVGTYVREKMEILFYHFGFAVGHFPYVFVVIVLLFTAVCSCGLYYFKYELDNSVWVPPDSIHVKQQKEFASLFQDRQRSSSVIAIPASGKLLDKPTIRLLLELDQKIRELSVEVEGKSYRFADLCGRKSSQREAGCISISIAEYWSLNVTRFEEDTNFIATISNPDATSGVGDKINQESIFAQATYDSAGTMTSSLASRLEYVLEKNPIAPVEAWENKFLSLMGETSSSEMTYRYRSSISYDQELMRSLSSDYILLAIGIFLILFFTIVTIGKPHPVRSRLFLGVMGICTVIMSITTGFGICAALGFPGTILIFILPFILIGIGIDDMFVLVDSYGQTDASLPVPKRIQKTLQHAGRAISFTSISDALAFLVTIFSPLPALSNFAIYAFVTIIINYIYMITFFTAFLTVDSWRQYYGLMDIFCCVPFGRIESIIQKKIKSLLGKIPEEDNEEEVEEIDELPPIQTLSDEDRLASYREDEKGYDIPIHSWWLRLKISFRQNGAKATFFDMIYARFLMITAVRAILFSAFILFFMYGCWGFINIKEKFVPIDSLKKDSYLRAYDNAQEQFFGGPKMPFNLVLRKVDKVSLRTNIAALHSSMSRDSVVDTATVPQTWTAAFESYLNASSISYPSSNAEYDGLVKDYIASAFGEGYAPFVSWDQSDVQASRYAYFMRASTRKDSLTQGAAVASVEQVLGDYPELDGFVTGWSFAIDATVAQLKPMLTYSFLSAAVVVGLVTLSIILHPGATLMIMVVILMIDVELFGVMYFFGIHFDYSSLLTLVIAVGLSVDYCAHVTEHFISANHGSRIERVHQALGAIGGSVTSGALSTAFGLLPLFFADSKTFFNFFILLESMVLVGLCNGMIFIPIILSCIGPRLPTKTEISQLLRRGQVFPLLPMINPDVMDYELLPFNDKGNDNDGNDEMKTEEGKEDEIEMWTDLAEAAQDGTGSDVSSDDTCPRSLAAENDAVDEKRADGGYLYPQATIVEDYPELADLLDAKQINRNGKDTSLP